MINGAHTIVYSTRPDATGPHWSGAGDSVCGCGAAGVFALPRAEIAVHPAEAGGRAEHYLLCDDVAATGTALQAEGIEVAQPISHQSGVWSPPSPPGRGRVGSLRAPPPDCGAAEPSAPPQPHN
jgi:hypothetical protein